MSDIILTGDNVNEGRIKINAALDGGVDFLWSAGTGLNSINIINGKNQTPWSYSGGSYSIDMVSQFLPSFNSSVRADYSHGEGREAQIFSGSNYSHIQNYASSVGNLSGLSASFSFAGGNSAYSKNPFCFSFGDYLVAGPPNSLVLGGFNNEIDDQTTLGNYSSSILGGFNNSINSNNISLTLSANTILGGSYSLIDDSSKCTIFGGFNPPSYISSWGQNKILSGNSCAIIGGQAKIADSSGCIAIGGDYYRDVSNSINFENIISKSLSSSILSSADVIMYGTESCSIIGSYGSNFSAYTSFFTKVRPYFRSLIVGADSSNFVLQNVASGPDEALPDDSSADSFIIACRSTEVKNRVTRSGIIASGGDPFASLSGSKIETISPFGSTMTVENSMIIGGTQHLIRQNGFVTQKGSGNVIVGGQENSFVNSTDCESSVIMGTGTRSGNADSKWILGWGGVNPAPGSSSSANQTIRFDASNGGIGFWDGTANLGPADYAEYFEWNDGNPLNEDRVGYFVSLTNDKVKMGNSNIVGIVSSTPSLIGDSAELKWSKICLKDEWGIKIYDTYKVYDLDDNKIYIDKEGKMYKSPPGTNNILGELFVGDSTNKIFLEDLDIEKINPDFDINSSYKPRSERKEWSPIGMLGKLHVRTSEQITGDTISADHNGMAINGNDYHVLENKKPYDGNYGVIKILFK